MRHGGEIEFDSTTRHSVLGRPGDPQISRLLAYLLSLNVQTAGEKSRAIELMITGNTFSFEEARDLGLVNQVIEASPEDFWEQVMDYARQFVPPAKASMAVGRIKRSVQSGWDLPLESALAVERELQQLLFQSSDAKEGIAANQEKRVPKFKGK